MKTIKLLHMSYKEEENYKKSFLTGFIFQEENDFVNGLVSNAETLEKFLVYGENYKDDQLLIEFVPLKSEIDLGQEETEFDYDSKTKTLIKHWYEQTDKGPLFFHQEVPCHLSLRKADEVISLTPEDIINLENILTKQKDNITINAQKRRSFWFHQKDNEVKRNLKLKR